MPSACQNGPCPGFSNSQRGNSLQLLVKPSQILSSMNCAAETIPMFRVPLVLQEQG